MTRGHLARRATVAMRAEGRSARIVLGCEAIAIDGAARLVDRAGVSIEFFFYREMERRGRQKILQFVETHLALGALAGLHTVATLDYIGLEAYRTRAPVQLEEQPAGIAKHRAGFVPTPQWRGGGAAVLTDWL